MLLKLQRPSRSDTGATAVEFALLLPILFLILLGVMQYGFGLYQLQNFNSIVSDASKRAGTGITSCADFRTQVKTLMNSSGLDGNALSNADITVRWLKTSPGVGGTFVPSTNAERLGLAEVTMTFHPFRIGAPFVPFPQTVTRKQTSPVLDTGPLSGGCT